MDHQALATTLKALHSVGFGEGCYRLVPLGMAIGMRMPKAFAELVGTLECALATLDIKKTKGIQGQGRVPPSPPTANTGGPKMVYPPALYTHPAQQQAHVHCTRATSLHPSWETTGWLHCPLTCQLSSPKHPMWVKGWPVKALLDSSSTIMLRSYL